MNHKKKFRKLNRTAAHRRALLRNLATSLILHNRIETTLPKAKELKRVADKLVTLGKKNTLHARRQALAYLMPINRAVPGDAQKDSAVHKLFTELAPRFADRQGGYTRVLRGRTKPTGKRLDAKRPGDNTQMAIIEFVEGEVVQKKAKKKRRVVKKAEEAASSPEASHEAA